MTKKEPIDNIIREEIIERAYQALGHPLPKKGSMHVPMMLSLEEQVFKNGYIRGATEQHQIDVDKACEAFRNFCYENKLQHTNRRVEEFRNKMDEFNQ